MTQTADRRWVMVPEADKLVPAILPVVGLCARVFTRRSAHTSRASWVCNRPVGHQGDHAVAPWAL